MTSTRAVVERHDHGPDRSPVGRFEWERGLLGWKIEPTTKLVGLALATYSNQDGTRIHPSQAQLARDVRLSVRTVRGHLAILRDDLCVIERIHRGSSMGRANYADVYRLCVPDDLLERIEITPMPGESDST